MYAIRSYYDLDREFHSSTGSEAILKYLQDNTSRRIVLTDKEIGCITVHMGEMDRDHTIERDRTYTQVITGKIDAELPGRLFKSMKSYLGDKGDPRFDVFGRKFRLEAIVITSYSIHYTKLYDLQPEFPAEYVKPRISLVSKVALH